LIESGVTVTKGNIAIGLGFSALGIAFVFEAAAVFGRGVALPLAFIGFGSLVVAMIGIARRSHTR